MVRPSRTIYGLMILSAKKGEANGFGDWDGFEMSMIFKLDAG